MRSGATKTAAARTTERLTLTPVSSADGATFHAYWVNNRAHLQPWSPIREGLDTLAYWDAWAERAAAAEQAGTAVHFGIDYEGSMIGQINLTAIVRGAFQACYLGFSLAADRQGKGYVREAAKSIIAFAFDDLGLHRIMANHMPENVRSAATLAALGFQKEGFAQAYLCIAGTWRDHVLTALTKAD